MDNGEERRKNRVGGSKEEEEKGERYHSKATLILECIRSRMR